MQHKIERLVSGQARKLAAPDHPLHFLLYSSNKHLQEDSKYVDLQVGKQVWLNVPRRMRQELWLSVLHKNRGAGAAAAKEYAFRVRQASSMQTMYHPAKHTHAVMLTQQSANTTELACNLGNAMTQSYLTGCRLCQRM